jgi:unsaturated chondroitin disaccharide hydrolase
MILRGAWTRFGESMRSREFFLVIACLGVSACDSAEGAGGADSAVTGSQQAAGDATDAPASGAAVPSSVTPGSVMPGPGTAPNCAVEPNCVSTAPTEIGVTPSADGAAGDNSGAAGSSAETPNSSGPAPTDPAPTDPAPSTESTGGAAGVGGTPNVGGALGIGGAPQGPLGGAAGSVNGGSASGGANTINPYPEESAFCRAELDTAAQHYQGYSDAYADPSQIPRSAQNGAVRLVATSDWTSGFPAGSFWLLYEHTADAALRTTAEAWTDALYGQRNRTSDHDVGFIINNSYGQGLRLTGESSYTAVLIAAAEALVTRYNPTVGAIRSWDFGSWQYPVIIDNMMNLELLFRASELSGDASYREVAISHAQVTLQNHFRADHSSYHVVDYNPSNGAVLARQTNQGLADESAWARGQAWGLYGYTMVYRETQDPQFLAHALAIADFYTGNAAMPEDGVPYFDFDAPSRDDVPDHRDASAGAIAVSALLELLTFTSGEARERYAAFAFNALRSLSSDDYRAALGQNEHFLLQHSVGNYPIDDEIDVAINYADYYYLEALLRCSQL